MKFSFFASHKTLPVRAGLGGFALLALLGWTACSAPAPTTKVADQPLVFVGTYTEKLGHVDGKASGIYTCRFDSTQGTLAVVDSAVGVANPSFVTLSPDHHFLYAVGENGGKPDQPYGSVAAYQVDANGHLTKINEVPSYGVAPCHVSTDHTGKVVFVANYVTGNIVSYGVKPDGGLTDSVCMIVHPGQAPNAHMVQPSPDNQLLWAVDKGADHVFVYTIGAGGNLTAKTSLALSTGAGPRHLAIHPTDPSLMAVINELSCSVLTFRYDAATGAFTRLDSLSTLPAGYADKNTCADLHFHPNGKFLYGSNRGHNSLVVYAVDAETGKLTLVEHTPVRGEIPRNFTLTPDGRYLLAAHQNSSTVAVFKVDGTTGKLTPFGPVSKVFTPVCLTMISK